MAFVNPNIYYFDNNSYPNHSYIEISANYENKKLSCEIKDKKDNVSIFQKKWIIRDFDKKREMLVGTKEIDFSLAQKFPYITCETILYDGLFFKKVQTYQNFSNFSNTPNSAPGIEIYTTSSVFDFSISDYLGKKSQNSYYFCESSANTDFEIEFCKIIDKETGTLRNLNENNFDLKKIKNIIGNEKYKIFNLTIGIKEEKKIIKSTGVQFVVKNFEEDLDLKNIPPKLVFSNNFFDKYFICESNDFIFNPNNKTTWYKNNNKIFDFKEKILPKKYIELHQEYRCENNNGKSDKFYINSEFLEIYGLSQIGFKKNESQKVLDFKTNLNLPENEVNWSCLGNDNISCSIIKNSDQVKNENVKINITITDEFKKLFVSDKIILSLEVGSEVFKKELIVYNNDNNEAEFEIVSSKISLRMVGDDKVLECVYPKEINNYAMYNVYWYTDNKEEPIFRNSNFFKLAGKAKYITCIVAGSVLDKNFIGASSLFIRDSEDNAPNWIKKEFLVDLNKGTHEFVISKKKLQSLKDINCSISSEDNFEITKNICFIDAHENIFLNISYNELYKVKAYLENNKPVDYLDIPEFYLNIKVFENNTDSFYKSKIKFYLPNVRPIIYDSGLVDLADGSQKCYVIAKDPQNFYLSTNFILENNNTSEMYFDFKKDNPQIVSKNLIEKSSGEKYSYYEFNFYLNKKEDYCIIRVNNGTNISYTKGLKKLEKNLVKTLAESFSNDANNIIDSKFKKTITFSKVKIDSDRKVNILIKRNLEISKNLNFMLNFYYKNNEKFVEVNYNSKNIFDLFLNQPKNIASTFINDNKINTIGSFLSVSLKNKNSNDYLCKAFTELKNDLFKYKVFLNGVSVINKLSEKSEFIFNINGVSPTDTVTCQVEVGNKIETSSLTIKDSTKNTAFCYGLDKNKSIFIFSCDNLDSVSLDLIKPKIENELRSQFDTLDSISYARIVLWSQSQKNKKSLTFKINNIKE